MSSRIGSPPPPSSSSTAAAAAAAAVSSSAGPVEGEEDDPTFAQTPEQIAAMKEMQRQQAVHMARLQAAGNMGADGRGGMKSLTPEECGGATDRYKWMQWEREITAWGGSHFAFPTFSAQLSAQLSST